jgi:hypothetical protein
MHGTSVSWVKGLRIVEQLFLCLQLDDEDTQEAPDRHAILNCSPTGTPRGLCAENHTIVVPNTYNFGKVACC